MKFHIVTTTMAQNFENQKFHFNFWCNSHNMRVFMAKPIEILRRNVNTQSSHLSYGFQKSKLY
jgi:hypothetical protein